MAQINSLGTITMRQFLHCLDILDELKCSNLCSRNVIDSLSTLQFMLTDTKPNPMTLDIEVLKNYPPDKIAGLGSPRMLYIYQGSLLRKEKVVLSDSEKRILKISNLEIEFERLRRQYAPNAPSRLSCVYLVENNIDGRIVLQNMFFNFSNPMIIEVHILQSIALFKADSSWIDLYNQEQKEDYIKKYWSGETYSKFNKWEYLLEGTIQMTNSEQINEIEEHTKNHFPNAYQKIQDYKQAQKSIGNNGVR